MENVLNKEVEVFQKKVVTSAEQVPFELDIVIPDYKPDVMRVITNIANICLHSSSLQNGKVIVDGSISFDIVYLTDDGRITSLRAEQPLTHSLYFPEGAVYQDVDIKALSSDGLVINSRKLGVRAVLSLSSSGYIANKQELTRDIEGEYEKAYENFECEVKNKVLDQKITARESIPCVGVDEILYSKGRIVNTKEKVAGNKVLLKGEIEVDLVQIKGVLLEKEVKILPFSEIATLDAEDITDVSCEYKLEKIVSNVSKSENEELSIDANLVCSIATTSTVSQKVLTDTFSLDKNIDVSYEDFKYPQKVFGETLGLEAAGQIQADEFENIVDILSSAVITDSSVSGETLSLSGVLTVDLLYKTASNYDGQKVKIPFEKKVPVASSGSVYSKINNIDVKAEVGASGIVDIKADIEIDAEIYDDRAKKFVSNVEESEESIENKPYALRIYYTKSNDSAWEIAKKFKIREKDVLGDNGDEFAEGQKIILQG
ncbi:DUF3794 domain-containing protein [Treponema sp. R6D11]